MDIQLLFGNPKHANKKKTRKSKKQKKKRGSFVKHNRKEKASMAKRKKRKSHHKLANPGLHGHRRKHKNPDRKHHRKHHRKHRNPAFHLLNEQGQMEKTIQFPAQSAINRLEHLVKKGREALAKTSPGALQNQLNIRMRYLDDALVKYKKIAEEARDAARYHKRQGGNVKLEAVTEFDKNLSSKLDQLAKFVAEAQKQTGGEVVAKKHKAKHARKRKAKHARKHKAKHAKKHKVKKHHKVKHARKHKSRHSRKSSRRHKALRSAHRKAASALKTVSVIKKMKKGHSRKVSVSGKKMTLKRTNPDGGNMTKEVKLIGHSGAEVGGLALGGAAIAVLNKLVNQHLPQVSQMLSKVPVVGPTLGEVAVPGVLAVLAHKYVKGEAAKQVTKGVIGAVVVKAASGLVENMTKKSVTASTPVSGVLAFPNRRGMGDVLAMPSGKADFDLGAMPQLGNIPQLGGVPTVATAQDFGYRPDQMNYEADFNGVPVREGFGMDGSDGSEGQLG